MSADSSSSQRQGEQRSLPDTKPLFSPGRLSAKTQVFRCVFPEPGEPGPRKPRVPDEHAQLFTVSVRPSSLTWVNWKGKEQAASHKSQLGRRSLGTRVYPGEAKPLPSASPANSQGSAEPQAHGFGCLTPAWAARARQAGKGATAGKFTVKDNFGFLSAVL